MSRVDEKCGCGAEFSYVGTYDPSVQLAAKNWREQHRHVEPPKVGICGDRSEPLLMYGGEIDQPWCELSAGHLGAHTDGGGRHWIKAQEATGADLRAEQAGMGLGDVGDGERLSGPGSGDA